MLSQWVNDSEFAGAVRLNPKAKDPIIGTQDPAESIFVIPQASGAPPIRITGFSSFTTTRAVAYCFLPSITAIEVHRRPEMTRAEEDSCMSVLTGQSLERKLATEEAEIAEIVQGFLTLQARAAVQDRPLRRATHAKGVCVRAKFEVFDVTARRDPALAARLAKGIYAKPGIYPATVRFSNSDPNVKPDFKPDVRALSFAVDLVPDGPAAPGPNTVRQDFSMQSAITLPINDLHAFVVLVKMLTASSPARGLWSLPLRDKLIFARTMIKAQLQTRQPLRPYQQLRYWSNVPFRHGPTDIVKYSASPPRAIPHARCERTNPNALKDELIRHLNEDATMSSFDFGLQFLDTEKMTYRGKRRDADFWIENASVEWKETQAPFHTVGRLTLLPGSQLSADESAAMYIDVTENSTPDSRPVGAVNRARWQAELASRKARLGRS